MDGLIGHTGFVGGHLRDQHSFPACFNTSNIDQIGDTAFDTLVCAAAPGSMFAANRAPDEDRAQIAALMQRLSRATARRFILISSIAVLARFNGQDDETSTAFQQDLAYGRHRRELEVFCQNHFPDCLIVRLPALFGRGLRKNFMFDLLNPVPSMLTDDRFNHATAALQGLSRAVLPEVYSLDQARGMWVLDRARLAQDPRAPALAADLDAMSMTALQFHHPETTYQFYDMTRIWGDIGRALAAGLDSIHLATEPLGTARIHQHLLERPMPETPARVHLEDMHTRHASLWSRSGPYIADAAEVLDRLTAFYAAERAA